METIGITMYGCGSDEAALFSEMAPSFCILPTCTELPLDESTVELAAGNRCVSISHKTVVTHATLRTLQEAGVKYISTRSAGYNHIDVDYAQSLGIMVENVMYSPDSVADYTLMLMLMTLRNARTTVTRADRYDFRLQEVRGKELRDQTVGVIGTGRIGAAVIERLRGFGCHILAYDHHPKTSAGYVGLGELLRQSDIVTLHTPLTAATRHLLGRHAITQMKQGAYIINSGRGPLIDTEALIVALESGRLGGAALDVLEGEEGVFYEDYSNKTMPLNTLLPRLLNLPNVIITPHTAYYTDHALRDTIEHSIANCLNFEKSQAACVI